MMIDIDVNPFPCGITDAELDPPDIYGDGDKFLTLPEGPRFNKDDDAIFSADDIDDLPWDGDRQLAQADDFCIDDLPLGDDDEQPATDPGEDPEIDSMPLGDEDGEEQAPATQDTVPAEEPPEEPAPGVQDTAPAEEVPEEQPEPEPEPEPDPRLPWVDRTRAQYDAIRRAREDVELVAQREIDEIVQDLEGGGLSRFEQFMDRLKAGEYADPVRAKKFLTFYFMMTFSTLDFKALCQDHDMAVWLWREYGPYIPPACWREYVEKTDDDDTAVVCVETFFKHVRDKYLHHMRDELAKREAAWEAAAMAATAAEDYAHRAVDSTGRLTQGAADVSRAARKKAEELEDRTAYGWRKAAKYAAYTYSILIDKDAEGMKKEYFAVVNEFFEKLNEYQEEEKR